MFAKFILYFKDIPQKTLTHIAKVFYDNVVMSKSFSIHRLSATEILGVDNKVTGTWKNSLKKDQTSVLPSRSLFQFGNGNYSSQGTRKEYAGRKLVGYSAIQMFDVVADVQNYQAFVPFCKKSAILSKTESNLVADLVIGFPPVIESYRSHVTLVRPVLVKAVCTEGKLFNHLLTTWKFTSGLRNNLQTCIIDFYVSFDFHSPLYSQLANLFFNELVRQMESAFYEEAKSRYGKPSIKAVRLRI